MLALALTALLAAAPKLAAPGLTVAGAGEDRSEIWTNHLAQHFTGFSVVTASDVKSVLGLERQRQLLGCKDGTACLTELGSALGVVGLVVGSVTRVEDGFRVNVKVIATSDGRVLTSRSGAVGSEASLFDELAQAGREMAVETKRALSLSLGDDEVRLAAPGPSLARRRAWAPIVAGALVAGAGAGLLLAAEDRYRQVTTGTFPTRDAASAVANEGKLFTGLGWTAAGAGAAAILTGIWLAVFGGDATPALQAWWSPSGFGLTWGGALP